MEKQLRYKGEFFSVAGVLWRVELWQDAQSPYPAVGELRFPAESPLVFEWSETDKLEPVQGSGATLEIVSKVDRQYKDLYTVEAGSIRMDVYRDGVLYWSGTLDTETYEEPFSCENEYEVKLTFSDFAMLERMNFSLRGTRSIGSLIEHMVSETKINNQGFKKYISTTCPYVSGEMLDSVAISCENFYDEEGIPMTMREVLEEILRPFALRIMQRAGYLFIYDLNAIQTAFEPEEICWESDDAVLGVDKIYKNVTLTFSPYPQKKLYTSPLTDKIFEDGTDRYYVAKDRSKSPFVGNNIGFMIDLKEVDGINENIEINKYYARLFKITPIFSGNEALGVASRVRNVVPYMGDTMNGVTPIDINGSEIGYSWLFKIRRTLSLPETSIPFDFGNMGQLIDGKSSLTNILLRLKVEVLIDGRYNPFEEATSLNGKVGYEKMQDVREYNVCYTLRMIDTDGTVKMHYENRVRDRDTEEECFLRGYKEIDGKWVDGDLSYNPNMTTLRYYDNAYTGWNGGWKMNHVGYLRSYVPRGASGEGDLIPIPPGCQGCTLELVVEGCFGRVVNPAKHNSVVTDSRNSPRWVLYKIPELTLVNQYGKEFEGNDIEYKSWLNSLAKEEKKIETIVGTPGSGSNFGMGMLMELMSRSTLKTFVRAGVSASLEKLLIGTWYSNYSRRMNMLSGTVQLLNRFGTYTDANETGTYIMVSEVQDVRTDESNVKLAEIAPDNFEGIEYE